MTGFIKKTEVIIMGTGKRIMLWDNLKFILITFVVIGHFIDYYITSGIYRSIFVFIYSFHMPLFIFAAGLFHRNKNIAYKVYTYIVISFILKIFIYVTRKNISPDIELDFTEESGVPWYMFAMAVFILLTYIFRDINKLYILVTWLIVACFFGYDNTIDDTFALSRIIIFYPFYLMGSMVNHAALEKAAGDRQKKFSAAVILIIWAALCVFFRDKIYALRPLFTARHPFDDTEYGEWFYRLLCYVISIGIGLCIILITPAKRLPFASEAGRRSIQVYFWHRPILYLIIANTDILNICDTPSGKIIWILCAIALTCLLSTKPFSFPAMFMLQNINHRKKIS